MGRDVAILANVDTYQKFQSTRPRGARQNLETRLRDRDWFQSTRPRGARPESFCERSVNIPGFNPRARVGRDRKLKNCRRWDLAFQSTRPRGARLGLMRMFRCRSCFNPRARVGRDVDERRQL